MSRISPHHEGFETPANDVVVVRNNPDRVVYATKTPGDSNHRLEITAGGEVRVGDGTTSPTDLSDRISAVEEGGTAALVRFWAAVRGRARTGEPVDIAVVSDSTATGVHVLMPDPADRWIELLVRRLAREYGGGWGVYYPARDGAAGVDWPIAVDGATTSTLYGLGLYAQVLDADAATVTVSTIDGCDRVLLFYRRQAGGGTLTIAVDGGAPVEVPTDGAGVGVWDSGSMSPAEHTIVVGRVAASGPCIVEGVMLEHGCRGAQAGFRLWDGSHSGYGAVEFAAVTSWADSLETVSPDLVVVAHGINDIADGAEDFALALDEMLDIIDARTTASLLLGTEWGNGNDPADTMAPLADVVRLAAVERGAALADMHALTGYFGASSVGEGLAFDLIHPVPAGSRFIERFYAHALGLAQLPARITQRYQRPGTYTIAPPRGAVYADVRLRGAGGGGGAGRKGAAGTVRCGGGPGGSGAENQWARVPVDRLAGKTLVVGAGGAGGAATEANDTSGADGANGGWTFIGPSDNVNVSEFLAGFGQGGKGGTAAGGAAGTAPANAMIAGQKGADASTTGGPGPTPTATVAIATAGGPGGGITDTDEPGNGGVAGNSHLQSQFLFTLPGQAGVVRGQVASGGGGGSASTEGDAQAGGAGTQGSGGGGGGAAVNDVGAGGAGGRGGDGVAEIVWHLRDVD